MPVDKFGRTTNYARTPQIVERVVSGGASLSQINDLFLQRDGSNTATADINLDSHKLVNVGNPTNDQDAATKTYTDNAVVNKVSKTGDTMTGNLSLSLGVDNTRWLGCNDLGDSKSFHIYLGNEDNQIKCQLDRPILLQTNNGFLIRQRGQDITRFGKTSTDHRI